MGRQEFITPEGLRQDGRRAPELRKRIFDIGVVPMGVADGSALVCLGNTSILCSVVGPRDASHAADSSSSSSASSSAARQVHDSPDNVAWLMHSMHDGPDVGSITCRMHSAAFSATTSLSSAAAMQDSDRRLREWSDFVVMALNRVVQRDLFPGSQVDIFLEILSADGGVLATALNAATLALIDAGVPLRDFVTALSGSWLLDTLLVDPTRPEERAGASVIVACLGHCQADSANEVVMIVGGPKCPVDQFSANVVPQLQAAQIPLFQEMRHVVLERMRAIFLKSMVVAKK